MWYICIMRILMIPLCCHDYITPHVRILSLQHGATTKLHPFLDIRFINCKWMARDGNW